MSKKISEKKKEYKEVLKKRQTILDRLAELKETDIIKEYKKLIDENDKLYNDENKLYKELKVDEYENCDHVLVNSYVDCEEGYGGRTIRYKGCIKCGCNEYVYQKHLDNYYLTPEEQAMYKYLESEHGKLCGDDLHINCDDFESAIKKYRSLKRSNKGLDEETILEMLKVYIKSDNEKTRKRTKDSYTVNIWDVP